MWHWTPEGKYRKRMEFLEKWSTYLSTVEVKELESGYLLIEEAYGRESPPRKSLPGALPEPCFAHAREVALMPLFFNIRLYLRSPVGTILGYLGHDMVEDTLTYDFAWVRQNLGEEAEFIVRTLSLPGKRLGVDTTYLMRKAYYRQPFLCETLEQRLVTILGFEYDHCHAAATVNCLKPLAKSRKLWEIDRICIPALRREIAEHYPEESREIENCFKIQLTRNGYVLPCFAGQGNA